MRAHGGITAESLGGCTPKGCHDWNASIGHKMKCLWQAVQESQAPQDAAKDTSSGRKDAKEKYSDAMEV